MASLILFKCFLLSWAVNFLLLRGMNLICSLPYWVIYHFYLLKILYSDYLYIYLNISPPYASPPPPSASPLLSIHWSFSLSSCIGLYALLHALVCNYSLVFCIWFCSSHFWFHFRVSVTMCLLFTSLEFYFQNNITHRFIKIFKTLYYTLVP